MVATLITRVPKGMATPPDGPSILGKVNSILSLAVPAALPIGVHVVSGIDM